MNNFRIVDFVTLRFTSEISSLLVREWCNENISRENKKWNVTFAPLGGTNPVGIYCFIDKKDAIMFRLRWGCNSI